MSSHQLLSAAANDRKARLAQLKSLKRKQAPASDAADTASASSHVENASALTTTDAADDDVAATYLSGRNFDPATRNVKLGFDHQPIADPTATLEYKARQLALESAAQQEAERADENKGLDLFQLQPKRPNWDLKRDLSDKTKVLDVATGNAIARLVRERVEAQKRVGGTEKGGAHGVEANAGDGEQLGMEGSELVEAMHLKEQEEERERRRDAEEDHGS
ncbi:hypothetical protein ACEQ8H_001959 [Pleosporales sp. CAS-2024a]